MIQLIVKEQYGSPDGTTLPARYRTFIVEHAELEKFLTEERSYGCAAVIGAEVLKGFDRLEYVEGK